MRPGYRFVVREGGLSDFDGPEVGRYEHPSRLKADGTLEEHPEQGSTIDVDGVERKVVDYQLNPDAGTGILVVEPLEWRPGAGR
jgi:hypothetical protein